MKHFQPEDFQHLHLCRPEALEWLEKVAESCPFPLKLVGDALSPFEYGNATVPHNSLNDARLAGDGFIVSYKVTPWNNALLLQAIQAASNTPAGMLPFLLDGKSAAPDIGIGLLPRATGRRGYPEHTSQIVLA
jgi:hypothetical protein